MIYQQKLKNHLIISGFTWILTIVLFIIWVYFNYSFEFLIIAGIFHLIFSIPAIYIHVDYYLRNAREEIEINNNELIVRKSGVTKKFSIEELSRIIIYKPASLDKGGIPFSAMEYYRYARIYAKSGEEIVITCLMALNIEDAVKPLNRIPIERKKRIGFLWWK